MGSSGFWALWLAYFAELSEGLGRRIRLARECRSVGLCILAVGGTLDALRDDSAWLRPASSPDQISGVCGGRRHVVGGLQLCRWEWCSMSGHARTIACGACSWDGAVRRDAERRGVPSGPPSGVVGFSTWRFVANARADYAFVECASSLPFVVARLGLSAEASANARLRL